jgi:methylated-DNA-[protein]-cysteine S-methyltransferase
MATFNDERQALKRQKIDSELVYSLAKQIPKGKVTSYGELAAAVGRPKAARAIGSIMHVNPYAPVVPCHRVVHKDGRIGGFGDRRGVARKIELLAAEGVHVEGGRVRNFKRIYFKSFKTKPS